MFANRVISNDGFTVTDTGVDIDIRVPWYRSLPLSVVSVTQVQIDGRPIDLSSITLEVNGKTFRLHELKEHHDEWWYVLDSAFLHVSGVQLKTACEHRVRVTVSIRPPYIPGFYRLTECIKRLRLN